MKVETVYTAVHRPYACFTCRKSFKRPRVEFRAYGPRRRDDKPEFEARMAELRLKRRGHICPQCGGPTFSMGVDFKPPRQADKRTWAKVESYIRAGGFYRHGWNMPQRILKMAGGFYLGRDLLNAVRQAGLTMDDIPDMYRHQIPDFIKKLNHSAARQS